YVSTAGKNSHQGLTFPGKQRGRRESRNVCSFSFPEQSVSILNMRSTDDLHTKARIRNAAIDCFSRDGFDVGIRQIAEVAGVSPGLVAHHFGSKAGLRAECDSHFLAIMLNAKLETVGPQGPEAMLVQLAKVEEDRKSVVEGKRGGGGGGEHGREQ